MGHAVIVSDPTSELLAAMAKHGLDPGSIAWDGAIHRFSGAGKGSRNHAGWYRAFVDQRGAVFGDYAAGLDQVHWQLTNGHRPGDLDPEEWARTKREWDEARDQRALERLAEQTAAAKEAHERWAAASTKVDPHHPYLRAKGVPPHGLRAEGDRLVIAMKAQGDGNPIANLQFIDVAGEKRFVAGGLVTGTRATLGGLDVFRRENLVFIAEGWATAAAIHEATRSAVVIAWNTGNLKAVALFHREKYADARIICCADNDRWSQHPSGAPNPGVTAAQDAARAATALVAIPDFASLKGAPTDFDDLLVREGPEQVRAWLDPDRAGDAVTIDVGSLEEMGTTPPTTAAEPRSAVAEPDVSNQTESALTQTDTGNASRLVELHGARLHYVAPWGRWLVCSRDGFWVEDHRDVRVRELAKDIGLRLKEDAANEPDKGEASKLFKFAFKSLNAAGISGMVDLARGIGSVPLDHELLDRNPWVFGVGNGVVDLRSGEHRPASPTDLITRRSPVAYRPDARAPRWERALDEWFPDPEVRAYVQRVAGSALVGLQRDHVFVIHYGLGGNGKGTFTRALQRVLGPYAIEIHLTLLVEAKHREHDTVKADLFRARLAVAVETDRRVKLAEASVKNLTGGDRIRARRMREDPWSFDPSHSLWLQTNHLPEISGRDGGIWRRIRVVKWERTFTGRAEDRTLGETLEAEGPGILRWLVDGCRAWQQHGLQEPEAVKRETLAYRQAEDTFSRFQESTGLVFRPELEIQAQDLQDLLIEWASGDGIEPRRGEVGAWLLEHGAEQRRRKWTDPQGKRRQARFWIGVGIEDGNHEAGQTHAL